MEMINKFLGLNLKNNFIILGVILVAIGVGIYGWIYPYYRLLSSVPLFFGSTYTYVSLIYSASIILMILGGISILYGLLSKTETTQNI